MCSQATLDAAPARFYVGTTLFDIGITFLCNCISLLHRHLACLGEIFLMGLHAFSELAAARWQLPAMSFDIGAACFDCRAGLCRCVGPKYQQQSANRQNRSQSAGAFRITSLPRARVMRIRRRATIALLVAVDL
jgi:hypothetical protein